MSNDRALFRPLNVIAQFFLTFFHNYLAISFHEYQGCHVFLFFSSYQHFSVPLFFHHYDYHAFLSFLFCHFLSPVLLCPFVIIKVIAQFSLYIIFITFLQSLFISINPHIKTNRGLTEL